VCERERADQDVGGRVGDREPTQVAGAELAARNARACPGEHVRRAVHPDHPVAARGQQRREPPGAAGGIHRHARRDGVDDLLDDRLVEVERRVVAVVVGRRPHPVAVDRAHALDLHRRAGQRLVGEQLPDLGDPCLHEVVVVLTDESAQQRDALEPEQVRQRVLVDHDPGP
jgi:hypothetical protein